MARLAVAALVLLWMTDAASTSAFFFVPLLAS